jgi:hypothetical protein
VLKHYTSIYIINLKYLIYENKILVPINSGINLSFKNYCLRIICLICTEYMTEIGKAMVRVFNNWAMYRGFLRDLRQGSQFLDHDSNSRINSSTWSDVEKLQKMLSKEDCPSISFRHKRHKEEYECEEIKDKTIFLFV